MGRRAQLFISARECVNVLACPQPTNDLYESDFGLCMIYTTRLKLISILQSLLHKMNKGTNAMSNLKQELLRYYKLNKIHAFQLEKYKECNKCKQCENENINLKFIKETVMYLQKVSSMITSMTTLATLNV